MGVCELMGNYSEACSLSIINTRLESVFNTNLQFAQESGAWISCSQISIFRCHSHRHPPPLATTINGIWISVVHSCLISLPLAMSVWCDNPQELINKPLTNKLELSPCTQHCIVNGGRRRRWTLPLGSLPGGGGGGGRRVSVLRGTLIKDSPTTNSPVAGSTPTTWLSANISKQKRKAYTRNLTLSHFSQAHWWKKINQIILKKYFFPLFYLLILKQPVSNL